MQRVGGWSHTYPTSGVQHHAGYQRLVRQLLNFHVAFLVLFIAKRFLLFYKAVEAAVAAVGGKGGIGMSGKFMANFSLISIISLFCWRARFAIFCLLRRQRIFVCIWHCLAFSLTLL